MEGVEGEIGKGYSKKESQQMASKQTLDLLRKKPQYIDAVFSAKADRTKMEEEPVEKVPETEVKDDFIITQTPEENQPEKHVNVFQKKVYVEEKRGVGEPPAIEEPAVKNDDFDLSDISAQPKEMSREDIIAAAEAAAFAGE